MKKILLLALMCSMVAGSTFAVVNVQTKDGECIAKISIMRNGTISIFSISGFKKTAAPELIIIPGGFGGSPVTPGYGPGCPPGTYWCGINSRCLPDGTPCMSVGGIMPSCPQGFLYSRALNRCIPKSAPSYGPVGPSYGRP